MSAWSVVALGDVTEIVSGGTPKSGVPEFWDGGIPWATPKDLSGLTGALINSTSRTITEEGLARSSAAVLPPGSVLFSSRAPIGHVAINTVPMAINQGFKSFVPKRDSLNAKYLFHWLRCNRTYLESLGNGATFKEVSKATISRVEIPLPPLEEQERIASVLDHADTLRAKRRESIARLDELTQSIFIDMFGDPRNQAKISVPTVARLGNVCNFYSGGTLPAGEAYVGQAEGYALLKVSDLNGFGNEKWIASSKEWSPSPGAKSATCPEGSVIIPKRGGAIGTNKKRISTRPSVLDPNLMAIWPNPEEVLLPYLFAWFQFLDLTSISSGSSVPQLNKKDLDPLKILIPEMEEQRKFARAQVALDEIREKCSEEMFALDALFGSLQSQAFKGEL